MHLARRTIFVSSFLTLLPLPACSTSLEQTDPGVSSQSQTQPLIDDPGACTTGDIGDGSCADPGTFKQSASQLCTDGLVLTGLELDAGACADGLFASASYTCCPPSPPSADPPKDANCGGGSACEEHAQSNAACEAVSTLEAQAAQSCADQGLTLVDRKFGGACPEGEATDAWFTCCAQPPAPEPTSCVGSEITSGACQDLGTLKTLAVAGCAPGLGLAEIKLEGACPDGQALSAWILCCAAPGAP